VRAGIQAKVSKKQVFGISTLVWPVSPTKFAPIVVFGEFCTIISRSHQVLNIKTNDMKSKLKIATVALVGLLLVLLNGCIPSIHPIYTKDKLVSVKELPGTWYNRPNDVSFNKKQTIGGEEKDVQVTINSQPQDRPETWQFKAEADKRYLLIHTDGNGTPAAFEVYLVKLGDNLFMDFYPGSLPDKEAKTTETKMNSMLETHLFPVHNFAKLEVGQHDLKISMFDPEFLKDLLERQQIRIKHEKTDGNYILTASPEELQKFAQKYAHVKEAFLKDPIVLSKKS
jgi:hypothetical protein